MEQQSKYFAFISYSSKDTEWGKRLQKKLEHYRMPSTLCSERGWERTPMNPVFFAPTDIQPGGLTEELQERLVGPVRGHVLEEVAVRDLLPGFRTVEMGGHGNRVFPQVGAYEEHPFLYRGRTAT